MKKFLLVLLVPLVLSATAVAANPASATAHCKNMLRKTPALFAPVQGATYANLAACVTAKTAEAAKNTTNAAKTCKAAKAANPTEFANTYSSAPNAKSNAKNARKAMGACVSATAKASTAAQQKAELNAAKKCKAERADATFADSHEGKTFAEYYGTNKNKKNAFGKCVSRTAKALHS